MIPLCNLYIFAGHHIVLLSAWSSVFQGERITKHYILPSDVGNVDIQWFWQFQQFQTYVSVLSVILTGAGYQSCLLCFLIARGFFEVFVFFPFYLLFYFSPFPLLRKKPAGMNKSERGTGLGCDWNFLVLFTGRRFWYTCWRWVLPCAAQHTIKTSRSVNIVHLWRNWYNYNKVKNSLTR